MHGEKIKQNISEESLTYKVVTGSYWMAALRIFEGAFAFIRIIVLARLLEPKDFGLFGIVVAVMGFIQTFTRPGLWGALVQKKESIDEDLNAVWTINLLRGVLLFIILFNIAPFISTYFNEPSIIPLMQFVGVSLLIQGAVNPGIVSFWKELENRKQFLFQLSGATSDLFVSIICAIILQNAWALILGLFARDAVQLIVSHLIVARRVRISIAFSKIKELYSFGMWIMFISILDFLLQQGSQMFIAKIFDTRLLGFYVMASQIAFMLCRNVIVIISRVTFPAYAKLQNDITRLRLAFLKTLKISAFLIVPITMGAFVIIDDFIQIFLGEKWIEMIPLLRILLIGAAIHSFDRIIYSLFQGIGRPVTETKIRFVQLILFGIGLLLLTNRFELLGVGYAFLLSEIFISFFVWNRLIKLILCDMGSLIKSVTFPIISVFFMVSAILVFKSVLSVGIISFLSYIIVGALTYFGVISLLDRYLDYGIIGLFRRHIVRL